MANAIPMIHACLKHQWNYYFPRERSVPDDLPIALSTQYAESCVLVEENFGPEDAISTGDRRTIVIFGIKEHCSFE